MSRTQDVSCGSDANKDWSWNGEKLIYPAATRNKDPILQVLKRFVHCDNDHIDDESPLFLEIASGSGQHLAYFAPQFPGVKFQPSEYDVSLLGCIAQYVKVGPTDNLLKPIQLDICSKLSCYGFQENSIDYIYNANMMHISPYKCTIGLFENAGSYLKSDALMITYGPYSTNGVISPESNVQFHASLKARDPSWGIREVNDLIKLGEKNDLSLIDTIEMPANNFTLIWRKH